MNFKLRSFHFFRQFLQVSVIQRRAEIDSRRFLYILTLIGFLQLASTNILALFSDDVKMPDRVLLTVIKYSNYLQLIDTYASSKPQLLYISILLHSLGLFTLFLLVLLQFFNKATGNFFRNLLKIRSIQEQMYNDFFFIPDLQITFHFLITDKSNAALSGVAGVFLVITLLKAYSAELRFRLIHDFLFKKTNHKRVTWNSRLLFIAKLATVILSAVLSKADLTYSSLSDDAMLAVFIVNAVLAFFFLVFYLREMNVRHETYSNVIAVCASSWLILSAFIYITLARGISDGVYPAIVMMVLVGYAVLTLKNWIRRYLLFHSYHQDLSADLFDFVLRTIFLEYEKAKNNDRQAIFDVMRFVEKFINCDYKKIAKTLELQCPVLEEGDKYLNKLQSEIVSNRKDVFQHNLKILLLSVIDLNFKAQIALKHREQRTDLIITYVSFAIQELNHAIKGYTVLQNFHHFRTTDKKASSLSFREKFVLENLATEMKQLLLKKFNPAMTQNLEVSQALDHEELLKETKQLFVEILNRYTDLFTHLFEKIIDLDKLFADGRALFLKKKKLEETLKRCIQINPYNKEGFYLYRSYLSLDVSQDRLHNFNILERKMLEHNSKDRNILNEELAKELNIFAYNTGVLFASLNEKHLGKIIKFTPGVCKIFGFSEQELNDSPIEILQPACVAEVHKAILMSRLTSTRRVVGPRLLTGVNKEQFLVPLVLALKLEPLGNELCSVGLMYRESLNHELILLNRYGYLLNYTETLYNILQLRNKYDDTLKPLQGLPLAVFIPALTDIFYNTFQNLLINDQTGMDEMPQTFFSRYHTVQSLDLDERGTAEKPPQLNEACTVYLFLPKLPERSSELSTIATSLMRRYNPFAISEKNLEEFNDLQLFEMCLDAAYGLFGKVDEDSIQLYQLNLKISHQLQSYHNEVTLSSYSVEISSVNLIEDPNVIAKELQSYKSLISAMVSVVTAAHKTSGTSSKNITKRFELRYGHTSKDSSRSRTTERNLTGAEVVGSYFPRYFTSHVEENKDSVVLERKNTVVEAKATPAKRVQIHEEMNESYRMESSDQRENSKNGDDVPEDSDRDVLQSRLDCIGRSTMNQSYGLKDLKRSKQTYEIRVEQADSKKDNNVSVSVDTKEDYPINLTNRLQDLAKEQGIRESSGQTPENTVRKETLSLHYTYTENQTINASKNEINSHELSSNEVVKSERKVALFWSSKSKESPDEENEERKLRLLDGSQRTSTVVSSTMTQFYGLMFDNSTPEFLRKFNIFGLFAFASLLLLMILLFYLLYQMFTQYKKYIELADYTCQLTSAYSYFLLSAEKLLMTNAGVLLHDAQDTIDYLQDFLDFQYNLYKTKYQTTAMVNNLEQTSTNFRYSDWNFTVYEPNLDGSTTELNMPYTEACIRFLHYMMDFLHTKNFSSVTNTTRFVVYYRQNYPNYFTALTQVTHNLFEDVFGQNRAIDLVKFSEISMSISLIILFMFIAAVYPLYRRSENILIRALSLFGTFSNKELEKHIYKFKILQGMVENQKDATTMTVANLKKSSRKTAEIKNSKRSFAGWRKKRASILTFFVILSFLYGAISVYFITDSINIQNDSNGFVPLLVEYDLSTDPYSFIPAMMCVTYNEINLYEQEGNDDYIKEVIDSHAEVKRRAQERVSQLNSHFANIEDFIVESIVTDTYADLLRRLRTENLCSLAAYWEPVLNASEVASCELLAQGLPSTGINNVYKSMYDTMILYSSILNSQNHTKETAASIVNTQTFYDYDRLAKYWDRAALYWISHQHDNLNYALDYQIDRAVKSFVLGVLMIFSVYLAIWRTFVWAMKTRFLQTKSLFSLMPADLILGNNYIKKFLRDFSKVIK